MLFSTILPAITQVFFSDDVPILIISLNIFGVSVFHIVIVLLNRLKKKCNQKEMKWHFVYLNRQ
ncbi:MAG: hypothetical protein JXN62_05295, partial [Bacteroidales bacterium]|nr:hypothetical protein [Bacteroidales bacterium]